ncbi:hypothetical protein AC249_AIPGENE23477 [Exaiptasia diaphana]|nr:hypothetical protein AC249_AIPGENE23477 [Exaiptasia diaphana]
MGGRDLKGTKSKPKGLIMAWKPAKNSGMSSVTSSDCYLTYLECDHAASRSASFYGTEDTPRDFHELRFDVEAVLFVKF